MQEARNGIITLKKTLLSLIPLAFVLPAALLLYIQFEASDINHSKRVFSRLIEVPPPLESRELLGHDQYEARYLWRFERADGVEPWKVIGSNDGPGPTLSLSYPVPLATQKGDVLQVSLTAPNSVLSIKARGTKESEAGFSEATGNCETVYRLHRCELPLAQLLGDDGFIHGLNLVFRLRSTNATIQEITIIGRPGDPSSTAVKPTKVTLDSQQRNALIAQAGKPIQFLSKIPKNSTLTFGYGKRNRLFGSELSFRVSEDGTILFESTLDDKTAGQWHNAKIAIPERVTSKNQERTLNFEIFSNLRPPSATGRTQKSPRQLYRHRRQTFC
jgi:hypothetical protein